MLVFTASRWGRIGTFDENSRKQLHNLTPARNNTYNRRCIGKTMIYIEFYINRKESCQIKAAIKQNSLRLCL